MVDLKLFEDRHKCDIGTLLTMFSLMGPSGLDCKDSRLACRLDAALCGGAWGHLYQ